MTLDIQLAELGGNKCLLSRLPLLWQFCGCLSRLTLYLSPWSLGCCSFIWVSLEFIIASKKGLFLFSLSSIKICQQSNDNQGLIINLILTTVWRCWKRVPKYARLVSLSLVSGMQWLPVQTKKGAMHFQYLCRFTACTKAATLVYDLALP